MNVLKKLIVLPLLAMISTTAFAAVTDNQVFAFAEANYPSLFAGTATAGQYQQYDYRYYPKYQNYLAVDNLGAVWIMGPAFTPPNEPIRVGPVSVFESQITGWQANQPASMCDTSTTAPAGFNYSRSGNTITVTTTGCVVPPTGNQCNPFSPRATGVNVLLTQNSSSLTWGGITFTDPAYSSIFNSMNSGFGNTKDCIRNAPDGFTNMTLNTNICLDATQQIGSSFSGTPGITATPPITMKMSGTYAMSTVPDCTTSGATSIYDAYTLQALIKQPDGTFK